MPDTDPGPYPKSLARLIEAFRQLPGVGKRSAERMAYHFLKCSRDEAMEFALAVRDLRRDMRACSRCFHISEAELCDICANPARDDALLCVVEMPRDVIAIEKTGVYRGLYHVLQGHLAPTDGVEPEHLRIAELFDRVRDGEFDEVILATNPTAEGDVTATYLAGELADTGVRVTRPARGIPLGSEIENVGQANLLSAFENRRE